MKRTISWLLGNQATEELVHDDDSGRPGDDLQKQFLPVEVIDLQGRPLRVSLLLPIHVEDLPGRHADDIPTPPPDCIG